MRRDSYAKRQRSTESAGNFSPSGNFPRDRAPKQPRPKPPEEPGGSSPWRDGTPHGPGSARGQGRRPRERGTGEHGAERQPRPRSWDATLLFEGVFACRITATEVARRDSSPWPAACVRSIDVQSVHPAQHLWNKGSVEDLQSLEQWCVLCPAPGWQPHVFDKMLCWLVDDSDKESRGCTNGSVYTAEVDAAGARRELILLPPGKLANMVLPNYRERTPECPSEHFVAGLLPL